MTTEMSHDLAYYLLCAGRHEEAEALLRQMSGAESVLDAGFAAVCRASAGDLEGALNILSGIGDNRSASAQIRALYTGLLAYQAYRCLDSGDKGAAIKGIRAAISQDEEEKSEALERLRPVMISAFEEEGRWEELEGFWEARLSDSAPDDWQAIHALAILNHRQAFEADEVEDHTKADHHWRLAHEYWNSVLWDRGFKTAIRQSQRAEKGDALSAKDAGAATQAVASMLAETHRAFAEAYEGKGNRARARQHREWQVFALVEQASARAIAAALAQALVWQLPVNIERSMGLSALERLGLMSSAKELLEALRKRDSGAASVAELEVQLSPVGKLRVRSRIFSPGEVLEQIDETAHHGNLTPAALAELVKIDEGVRARRARELNAEGKAREAMKLFKDIRKLPNRWTEAMSNVLVEIAQSAAKPEGTSQKAYTRAIGILEYAIKVERSSILERDLGTYYRNRAVEKWNSRNFDGGRADIRRALEYSRDPQIVQDAQTMQAYY